MNLVEEFKREAKPLGLGKSLGTLYLKLRGMLFHSFLGARMGAFIFVMSFALLGHSQDKDVAMINYLAVQIAQAVNAKDMPEMISALEAFRNFAQKTYPYNRRWNKWTQKHKDINVLKKGHDTEFVDVGFRVMIIRHERTYLVTERILEDGPGHDFDEVLESQDFDQLRKKSILAICFLLNKNPNWPPVRGPFGQFANKVLEKVKIARKNYSTAEVVNFIEQIGKANAQLTSGNTCRPVL